MPKLLKPEAAVQRAVLDLLAAERIFALRLNTGAMRTANGRPFFAHSGGPGVADVLAFPYVTIPASRDFSIVALSPLWIECKSETGKQSSAQRDFQAQVEAHGHAYLIARGSDDVLAWLKEHGAQ